MPSDDDFVKLPEKKKYSQICKCEEKFNTRSSYYKHLKCCPATERGVPTGKFICLEENCSFNAKYSHDLLQHLEDIHNKKSVEDVKIFQNYSDFKNWLQNYEKEETASFIRNHIRTSKSKKTEYYCCNRSGKSRAKAIVKRCPKLQGSRKIGFSCPASIRAVVEIESSLVTVKIKSMHYGHEPDLCHINFPKNEKVKIANQLLQGVHPDQVMKNVFDISSTKLERQHLCTKKDLTNIIKSYGINNVKKHDEDYLSVDLYVEELKKESSLLLYKRQGDESFSFPNLNICSSDKNDFALGLMTPFQMEMLKKFGNDIVCLDATHGTKLYSFNLMTISVVDEYRERIPVAWLISNKETRSILKTFFSCIKKEIGELSPKWFMSDKASQYYGSWTDVFSFNTKKLLCHCHVHKDWKRQLIKIKEKDTLCMVYKSLCLLIEERDKDNFNILLQKTCEKLLMNPKTEEFGKYFITEWSKIPEQWAKCHRIGAGINANMYLESFHKTLKCAEKYFKGKHGRWLEKCLATLLQFSKDMALKHLIKTEKGKTTEMFKKHKSALKIPTTLFEKISGNEWNVKSEQSLNADISSYDDIFYFVKKLPLCKMGCKIFCQFCKICIHSYSCNCPDGLTGTTICKHIHGVARIEKDAANHASLPEEEIIQTESIIEETAKSQEKLFEIVCTPINNMNSIEIKNKIMLKISQIQNLIKTCSNEDLLLASSQHINNAFNVLNIAQLEQ